MSEKTLNEAVKLAQSTKNIWCEYSDIAEDECTSCIHFNNKKGGGKPKKTSGLNESIHPVKANESVRELHSASITTETDKQDPAQASKTL